MIIFIKIEPGLRIFYCQNSLKTDKNAWCCEASANAKIQVPLCESRRNALLLIDVIFVSVARPPRRDDSCHEAGRLCEREREKEILRIA